MKYSPLLSELCEGSDGKGILWPIVPLDDKILGTAELFIK
jgi:hypothetical protein